MVEYIAYKYIAHKYIVYKCIVRHLGHNLSKRAR